MKIGVLGIAGLLVGLALLVVGYSAVFTVSQTEQVLLVRRGKKKAVESQAEGSDSPAEAAEAG